MRPKSLLFPLLVVAAAFAALPACAASGSATRPSTKPAAASPCGKTAVAPTYTHVIWVLMENHSYDAVIGAPKVPYENSLAAQCGLATNYHNITHPSLPNYIAATSGLSLKGVKKFQSDCDPSAACSTTSPSIFSQAPSWKSYEESMPSNCSATNKGNYAVRHNPPMYYTTLPGCSSYDVPYTALATDLANNTLPAFSFITPNLVDDTHNATVATGDKWLKKNLPLIFASPAYQAGNTVLVLTWDEGEGGTSTKCATNTTDIGCHVATIIASPSTIPGTQSSALFNHYSLLRSTEELLGLPYLGQAATATSMVGAFNL